MALLSSRPALAANWEFAPRVQGGYRYSDNYHLDLPGGEIDVSGAEADAAVTFRTLDPRTQVRDHAAHPRDLFPGREGEDSTDYYLTRLLETRRRDGAWDHAPTCLA